MAQPKKVSPPWADEVAKPKKTTSNKKKTKSKALTMSVYMAGNCLELSFENQRALEVAKVTISERCSRGSAAHIVASGKSYSFIPNLGYLVADSSD